MTTENQFKLKELFDARGLEMDYDLWIESAYKIESIERVTKKDKKMWKEVGIELTDDDFIASYKPKKKLLYTPLCILREEQIYIVVGKHKIDFLTFINRKNEHSKSRKAQRKI